jgi:hypothetical protein
MRTLTPIELAIAFAIGGSVLAVFIPVFVRNVHASRLSEPLDGLQRIGARAVQLADGSPQSKAFPESVPQTPTQVPRGELVKDQPGTWNHSTWRMLDFSFDVPHAYSFEVQTSNGPERSTFTATARGDLDGDGVLSSFEVTGSVKPGQAPVMLPLEVRREIE